MKPVKPVRLDPKMLWETPSSPMIIHDETAAMRAIQHDVWFYCLTRVGEMFGGFA